MAKKTTAQKIANPAWRKGVSDKALKSARPDLYAKRIATRKTAQENATLYDPSVVLSGNDLRRAVNSQVDAETRPAMASLDRDIGNEQAGASQRTATSNASFDRLAATMGQAAGAAQANIPGTVAQSQAITTQAQQGLADFSAKFAPNANGNDPNGLPGGNGLATAVANGQAKIAAGGQADASQAQQQGAGWAGMLAAMTAAEGMSKGQAAQSIGDKSQSAVTDLRNKRADLVTSRGSLRSKYTQDMRQQQFTNAATLSGLSTTAAKLRADIADDRADNSRADTQTAIAAKNADTSAARLTESQRHDRVTESISASRAAAAANGTSSTANGKDAFGNTPRQQQSAQDSYTKALTIAKQYDPDDKESEQSLYELLVSPQGGNLNASMARAAAQMVKLGRVGPNTARTLRSRGISAGFRTGAKKATPAGGARTK